MEDNRQEAVYLVGDAVLLHLKEASGQGDFDYALFDDQTREKVGSGRIARADVLAGIDLTHDHITVASKLAMDELGLGGNRTARVGLTSLKEFPTSDIRGRTVWEPETVPKDDIRFIDSSYNELFRIPDGGVIEIVHPGRVVSAKCEFLDECHTRIGSEVYHICQFAELLESNGGACYPEPVLDVERAAWKIGWDRFLAVESGAGYWEYTLLDQKFTELDSGKMDIVGCSACGVRDMVLTEKKLGHRSMVQTDYYDLMEKSARRQQEIYYAHCALERSQRPSIKAQLTAAKAARTDRPAAQQRQTDKGAR